MSSALSTAELIEQYIEPTSPLRYELQFTPDAQRHAAAALLSFERQMRALVTLQRDVAPVKIHWWHEELQRLQSGAPRHPLTQALAEHASEPLCVALNEILHGAVMDYNAVEIDAQTLPRYFQLRGGALHAALAAVAGTAPTNAMEDLGAVMTLTELLAEARDPALASAPVATLLNACGPGDPAADPQEAEIPLRERREQAADALRGRVAPSATSAVRLALYNARWPLIIATPYGTAPPQLSPWRTLHIAWRAARQFARQESQQ